MKKRKKKSPLDHNQDGVLQDYKNSFPSNKRKSAAEALHMFFSPNRIPVGLTDEEMRICAILYPLRKAAHDRIRDRVIAEILRRDGVINTMQQEMEILRRSMPRPLPDELRPNKVMARTRFKKGIYAFLLETAKILE